MIIVGLNDVAGAHHNSSVALVKDGKILFAASEERFTRVKFDMTFPKNALQAALDYAGIDIKQVDYFAIGYPASSFYNDLFCRSFCDLPRSLFGLIGHNFFGMLKYVFPNIRKMYKPAVFFQWIVKIWNI